MEKYTKAEVSSRNGKNGSPVWIIIKDSVYDVTSFVNEHPGGSDLIIEWAGKDATKAFNEACHSHDATSILKKYKIGEISNELIMNSTSSIISSYSKDEKFRKEKRRIKLFFCV